MTRWAFVLDTDGPKWFERCPCPVLAEHGHRLMLGELSRQPLKAQSVAKVEQHEDNTDDQRGTEEADEDRGDVAKEDANAVCYRADILALIGC